MNPYYFSVGGLVFAIFVFKRELLVRRASVVVILVATTVLFALGIILLISAHNKSSAVGALFVPLLSLLAYRLARALFVRSMGREPQDTYLNWSRGLASDRVFNILFVTIAGFIWIFTPLIIGKILP
jgi:uncharacterized membrane protein